jgi:hypothetical protein
VGAGMTALAFSGSVAFAGERGGNGEATPIRDTAASACAFSGLDDMDFEAPVEPGVVQNWGAIIREAGPLGGANSTITPFGEDGCNAHAYPNKDLPNSE